MDAEGQRRTLSGHLKDQSVPVMMGGRGGKRLGPNQGAATPIEGTGGVTSALSPVPSRTLLSPLIFASPQSW